MWFVVRVDAKRSALAAFFMRGLGLEVASPMCTVPVYRAVQPWRSGGRLVPMFPGYLLVLMDLTDTVWRRVPTLPGVQRILGDGPEDPTPLPHGVVEEILARPDDALDRLEGAYSAVTVGVTARVIEGPLAGQEGACVAVSRRGSVDRVTLLLSLLGMPRPVELLAELVERAA